MSTLIPALLAAAFGWLPPADPGVDPRGSGAWPLRPQPEVVSGFEPPASTYGAGHRGVDLAGSAGQRVHAAMAGEVTFAGRLAGRGVVVVAHGETRTTYEPVRATVRVGDRVSGGTPIGVLELPLSHCFPRACLHWGWLRGETYLDPLALVGAGPVRLKPWAGLPSGGGGPGRGDRSAPGQADGGGPEHEAGGSARPGVGADVAARLLPAPLSPVTAAAVQAVELVRDQAGRPQADGGDRGQARG